VRATGYWLFARLLIIRSELVNQIDPYAIMEKMVADLESGSYFLRLSAQRALTFLGRSSATFSQKILAAIQDFNSSDDIVKNEIFESLNFEFTNFPG
jgi:formate hydrogenlyase subunit 4